MHSSHYVGIGYCDLTFPLSDKVVGDFPNSYGIHGESVTVERHTINCLDFLGYNEGDVIGCGIEVISDYNGTKTRQVFFTRNGALDGIEK